MNTNDKNRTKRAENSYDNVDWSKYGLGNTENPEILTPNYQRNEELSSGIYQTGANELYAQEFVNVLLIILILSLIPTYKDFFFVFLE